MSPFTLIKIALKALLRNRMRTFLSVLGIVIGVARRLPNLHQGTDDCDGFERNHHHAEP